MRLIGTKLGMTGLFAFMLSACALADESDDQSIVYGFGSPATAEEIAAWDIDVMPDGEGLPPGRGTAAEGAEIYAVQCAACHGFNGEGGLNDRLVAHPSGEAFPDASDPDSGRHRTIGNYWPYATTVFDYIRRSMPFNLPGSLEDDEVYALTAHLLYLNNIISEDAEMNADTLPEVEMPAQGKFVVDDRDEYQEVH